MKKNNKIDKIPLNPKYKYWTRKALRNAVIKKLANESTSCHKMDNNK